MRAVMFGGAPDLDQKPAEWLGYTWHIRFDSEFFTHYRNERLPRIERERIEEIARDTAQYDMVWAETEQALILVREWDRLGLGQRVILALEVNATKPLLAVRQWYREVLNEDPWPMLRDAPWVTWLAATPAQKRRLLSHDIPADHIHSFTPSTSVYKALFSSAEEHFEAVAAGARPNEEARDTVIFPGSGRRDWATILRTAHAVPELPCLLLGGRRRELERIRMQLGITWPPNLRHIEQVPLRTFIEMVGAARVCVVPLLPGDGDGGHTTVLISYRVGTPVICTDSPGLGGFHKGNETVSLVPVSSPEALSAAIREVWHDDSLRKHLAESGKRYERELDVGFEEGFAAAIARAVSHVPRS